MRNLLAFFYAAHVSAPARVSRRHRESCIPVPVARSVEPPMSCRPAGAGTLAAVPNRAVLRDSDPYQEQRPSDGPRLDTVVSRPAQHLGSVRVVERPPKTRLGKILRSKTVQEKTGDARSRIFGVSAPSRDRTGPSADRASKVSGSSCPSGSARYRGGSGRGDGDRRRGPRLCRKVRRRLRGCAA